MNFFLLTLRAFLFFSFGLTAHAQTWVESKSLAQLIQSPHTDSTSLYGVKDHLGRGLDGLKIEQESGINYIGVYHTLVGPDKFCLRVATSTNLTAQTWTHRNDLDCDFASQGEIKRLPDGKYLLAFEKNPSHRPFIQIRLYNSVNDLLANRVARSYDLPRTPKANSDGTPNFRWIRYDGNLDTMTIEIGFHFNRASDGKDINAIGFVRGMKSFDSYEHTVLNRLMESKAAWHIGDRTFIQYQGRNYTLIEGMTIKNNWNSWRLFLFDEAAQTLQSVDFSTPKNSPSHGNPNLNIIQIGNELRLVGTVFIFETSEGGCHLFQRTIAKGTNIQQYKPKVVSPPVNLNYPALQLQHQVGQPEQDGWSVNAGQVGHMLYGPYVRTLPHAPMIADIRLKVDNNTAENHVVLSFDVYDASTGQTLAFKQIRRQELPPPGTWGTFSLPFDMRYRVGHAIEVRLYSHGISYVKASDIRIREY